MNDHENVRQEPSVEEVRQALAGILAAEAFANSPRLQAFLTYIVEETIAGRGSSIKGKRIAADVYGREIDEAGGATNLVRVEARRLRRALDEVNILHQADKGWRIYVDVGSYRPRFEFLEIAPDYSSTSRNAVDTISDQSEPTPSRGRKTALAALAALGVATAFYFFSQSNESDASSVADAIDTAKRAALSERSIESVQSVNIAEQARGMFFPLFDLKRQQIAFDMFRHAEELDQKLPGGYAGQAQVLALLSIMSKDANEAAALLVKAKAAAEKGMDIDPTSGWTQAVTSWTLAVAGEMELAVRHARIAIELSPDDGHVLDLVGLTGIVVNNPELTAEVSSPQRERNGSGRFGANSIWGTSQLMLENYKSTIEAFSTATERGLPISAASLMLLATAYHHSGDEVSAERTIREMSKTWPEFPAEFVAGQFFSQDQKTYNAVIETLTLFRKAG